MSTTQVEISRILGKLRELAPAGYALGFHIQYTTPKFVFQTYAKTWLDYYSKNGLIMTDPMVAWGFENTGFCLWSSLDDPTGVLHKAADHGMKYGLVYATETDGSRSIGGFARNDREFNDDEIAAICATFEQLHAGTADQAELTEETVKQLKNMSVMVTHPGK